MVLTANCSKKISESVETETNPIASPIISSTKITITAEDNKYIYDFVFSVANAETLYFFHYTRTLNLWSWEAMPIMFPPMEEKKWHKYPAGNDKYRLKFSFKGLYTNGTLAIVKASNKEKNTFVSVVIDSDTAAVVYGLTNIKPVDEKK